MSKIINEFGQALDSILLSFGREPSQEDKRRREEKVDQLVAQDVAWLTSGREGRAALEELLRIGWPGYRKETESTLDEMLRQRRETTEMIRSLIFDKSED